MFTIHESQLKIARVTLEAQTPLSIGSGETDPLYDTPLMRDANGLPTIPATALVGILRRAVTLMAEDQGLCETFLFGDQEAPSRLRLSFAHIHDSQNRPVDGRGDLNALQADPILKPLLTQPPRVRERNRLSHRGVVDDRGKFDRNITPAGHRFTTQLTLAYAPTEGEEAERCWKVLQQAAHSVALRFGGATRSGLGAVKVVNWQEATLDLRQKSGRTLFCNISPDLSQPLPSGLSRLATLTPPLPKSWSVQQFSLEPLTFWRTGQGSDSLKNDDRGKAPDLLSVTEPLITWSPIDHRATLATRLLFPGSGMKGALRQRTEFHYRCQLLASELSSEKQNQQTEMAMVALFGTEEGEASAGKVIVNDCYLAKPVEGRVKNQIHNSIDRYTMGGRHGALFTEQLVKEALTVTLLVCGELDPATQQALDQAVADLKQGRLALGAASSRGHGYFKAGTPPPSPPATASVTARVPAALPQTPSTQEAKKKSHYKAVTTITKKSHGKRR